MRIKNNKELLIIGLLLFIIGFIINIVCNSDNYQEVTFFQELLFEINGVFFFIYVCLIAPIFEELIFRAWGIKRYIGKVISLIGISLYVYITTGIWVAILFAALYSCVLFFLRNKKLIQMYSFVFLTSIFFALSHNNNLNLKIFIFAIPMYLGLSFIFSYLVIRFNLFVSILAHILYNTLLMMIGGFFFSFEKPLVIRTNEFNFELKYCNAFKSNNNESYRDDTIYIPKKNITSIARVFLDNPWNYQINEYPYSYKCYSLKIESSNKIIKASVIPLLEKKVDIDTIKEVKKVYFMSINDTSKINRMVEGKYRTTFNYFCMQLSNNYNTVVFPDNNFEDYIVYVNFEPQSFFVDEEEFEKRIEYFENEYGFRLRKKDTIVNVIRIREK